MKWGETASTNKPILSKSEFKDGKLESSTPLVQPPIKCPECTSQRVWKDGIRKTNHGDEQRWLCRSCGYRFSGFKQNRVPQLQIKKNVTFQPFKKLHSRPDLAQIPIGHSDSATKKALNDSSFSICEDISPHGDPAKSTVGKTINAFASTTVNAKYALGKKAKNLVKVKTRQKQAAGATRAIDADVKGKIIEYAWWMKKEGYAESTITRRAKLLKTLSKRHANLLDPESVKLTIAKQKAWSLTTKEHAVTAYTSFLKMHKGTWKPPKYKRVAKLPFIPTETEIEQLIASCNRKTSAFLQLLKETGMRCGEAWKLEWTDFDFENRTVRITPEKGGNPRILKMSNKLVAMLNALLKDFPRPFRGSLRHFARTFRRQRKRAAYKLQNKRIEKITFHTLRHWKATMEYHRTKDILHVKQLLGHRSIQSTLIYTHLVNFEDDQFTCRTARTLEEAKNLIEAGFDYITDIEDKKLFRKRK